MIDFKEFNLKVFEKLYTKMLIFNQISSIVHSLQKLKKGWPTQISLWATKNHRVIESKIGQQKFLSGPYAGRGLATPELKHISQ
jgi:hypothetical protein